MQTLDTVYQKVMNVLKKVMGKAGSSALQSAVRSAVNTMAYDTATWIASGDYGQKPLFLKEDWESYLYDTGMSAAADMIENGFGTEGNWTKFMDEYDINVCEPEAALKVNIGLGLVKQERPDLKKPRCDFDKVLESYKSFKKPPKDYLRQLTDNMSPYSSDLGIALTLNSKVLEVKDTKLKATADELSSKEGWLDIRNIAGEAKTTPKKGAREDEKASDQMAESTDVKPSGSILVDAANVFLNQLAAQGFETLMKTLGEDTPSDDAKLTYGGLLDAEEGPLVPGVSGAKMKLKSIVEPKFDVRGDYNVLAELSSCPESELLGVGPTSCVIDEKFRQAIEDRKTVAEALDEGLLKGQASFAFKAGGVSPVEPKYNEGYPYRSLLILRKFRIIPVTWELLAEYIQANSGIRNHAKLDDLVACYDPNDSFTGYNDDGNNEWCEGFIDPRWVLKAPQNYCAKEGYGPQIVFEEVVEQGENEYGEKMPSELMVSRLDNYCADEQSCIKENDDGSCEYFGYCTEERRKWAFSGDSCEPVYNTCQTFKSEEGDKISYLKNTIDYCSSDNYGCEKYSVGDGSAFDTDTGAVDWGGSSRYIYLNKETEPCDSSSESCNQYIRISPGLGANLIYDGSFEQNSSYMDWESASERSIVRDVGGRYGNVLKVESDSSGDGLNSYDRSGAGSSIMPEGFVMEPEVSYTLSADIYVENGGDEVILAIGREGEYWEESRVGGTGQWVNSSVTIRNNDEILANEWRVYVRDDNTDFYIDNLKFEVGAQASGYSDYLSDNNLIYEKVIPNYLEDECYEDAVVGNYSLKDDAPLECREFARKCNRDEAGCEIFTDMSDGTVIPAKVGDSDYCVSECVGYDNYIQDPTSFISYHDEYLIPETARECGAESVGCEEFTDLDESGQGAEKKVYYSYLRQCIKPNAGNCAPFYSWQGDEDEGQQLVTYQLEVADSGSGPKVTSDDSSECSADIYDLPPTDPRYNPDCREFYDRSGVVYYHLYSRTISCTDNCHPLRLTRKNVDQDVTRSSDCSGTWDNNNNECYICSNGGDWSDQHNSCIYQAVLEESRECSADANGCKEYNGNQGGNTRIMFVDSFESGDNGWSGGSTNLTSVVAGQQAYRFSGNEIENTVGLTVDGGSGYVLSFLAKGISGGSVLSARFDNDAGDETYFKDVEVDDREWQIYTTSIASAQGARIDHTITSDEKLVISGEAGVLIDDIKLTKILDRYYLVQDSWNTPTVCDTDVNGNPYPYYMAGCSEYSDRFSNIHYLHSFTQLCQESAAGCEAVIDTANYSDPGELRHFSGSEPDAEEDQVSYVVYDPDMACNPADKGCQRLGQAYTYENSSVYKDSYLKNDPDKYETIACSPNGVGCDRWNTNEGEFYFKDPGNMVCEYKQKEDGSGWAWFKKKVKRCLADGDDEFGKGRVCLVDQDCGIDDGSAGNRDKNGDTFVDCVIEETADLCPVDNFKTIGFGGAGNEVYQPASSTDNVWVGLCPASESGCTEYIDATSDFNQNLVRNPDFSQDINNDREADSWTESSGVYNQDISLEGNTLYVLDLDTPEEENQDSWVRLGLADGDVIKPIYILNGREGKTNNTFKDSASLEYEGQEYVSVGAGSSFAPTSAISENGGTVLFYLSKNWKDKIYVNEGDMDNGNRVSLKKAIVDYQIIDDVDKSSCAGQLDPLNGCVLFNERAHNGSEGLSTLQYEAEASYGSVDENTQGCDKTCDTCPDDCYNNANQIIKVRPDRVCSEWLACKSYIKDENGQNVCFDIGACDRLDELGECANFKIASSSPQRNEYTSDAAGKALSQLVNRTGYSKAGYEDYYEDFKRQPNDLFDLGQMGQMGHQAIVPNGDFELFDSLLASETTSTPAGLPSSWEPYGSGVSTTSLFTVIADPVTAQKKGLEYPVVGKAFLKYNAGVRDAWPVSTNIDVRDCGDDETCAYYLSFYINTEDLKGGSGAQAEISIIDGDTNQVLMNGGQPEVVSVPAGQNWQVKVNHFQPQSRTIKILLGASTDSSGVVYIDDVRLDPVLYVKDDPYWDIRQTCKLYPDDDSLACEYIEDSGIYKKGEYGYCLEYDRYPGDPDACLLWWPIDKVKGSGLSENLDQGYNSEGPLYYCVEGPTEQEIRPYIDASSVAYMVDEKMRIKDADGTYITGGDDGWLGWEASGCSDLTCIPNFASSSDSCKRLICGSIADTPECRTDITDEDLYFDVGCTRSGSNYQCSEVCINGERTTQRGNLWNSPSNHRLNPGSSRVDVNRGRIYLDYGETGFTIEFKGSHTGGVCFLQMVGNFKYYNDDYGNHQTGHFNLSGDGDSGANTTDMVEITLGGGLRAFTCELRTGVAGIGDWGFEPEFNVGPDCGDDDCEIGDEPYKWIVSSDEQGDAGQDDCREGKLPGGSTNITLKFLVPELYPCDTIARVSTIDNDNKAWVERLADGSDYEFDCNTSIPGFAQECFTGDGEGGICSVGYDTWTATATLETDDKPFGSLVPPDPSGESSINFANDPRLWADVLAEGGGPIIYREDNARMGQLHTSSSLQGIFTQSYGTWAWDHGQRSYVSTSVGGWDAPENQCSSNIRGEDDICGVRPDVVTFDSDGRPATEIKVNGNKNADIIGSGFVNLTFNSIIDPQQAPLTGYDIDWGDGETLPVSTGGIKSKPDPSDPHSVFHFYSYKQLVNMQDNLPTITCSDAGGQGRPYCEVIPRVKLRDNWGWCSEGMNNVPCPTIANAYCAAADPAKTVNTSYVCMVNGLNSECSAEYPICMDGWEELDGKITVYME